MQSRRLVVREELFERVAPFRKRFVRQILAAKLQRVEQHQFGRMLGCELAHPALGGMKPKLKRVERQRIADRDDELAIDQEAALLQPAKHLDHVGKVAAERLARLGGQRDLVAVAASEAAEAVPLGLELPSVAVGQLGREKRFHRRRDCRALGHRQTIAAALQSFPLRSPA